MQKIIVNNRSHSIPTSWDEVNFKTFIALLGIKDDTHELISALIGIPVDELRGAKIAGLEKIIPLLAYMKKEPAINENPIKLGAFVFPTDVTFETIEQFEDTRNEINRVTPLTLKDQTEALALYAAIYLTDPYSSGEAQKKALTFYDYPCLEVMSAGSFFHAKCLSMQSGYSMNYLRKNTLLKKNRPVLNRLIRRLGFMLRLTPSRVM